MHILLQLRSANENFSAIVMVMVSMKMMLELLSRRHQMVIMLMIMMIRIDWRGLIYNGDHDDGDDDKNLLAWIDR